MKKKLLIGFSVVSICAAFWACGTGDIETVGMGDENARDLYGFDPDAMDQLVADAKKNCADDPKCVAAQENAEPIGSDDEDEGDEDNPGDEEDSSASSSPSSSGTTAGSYGAVAGSSAATGTSSAATGTSSAATGSSSATATSSSATAKSSSSVYHDPTGTIGGGCKAVKNSIDKGGSTQWYYSRIGTVIPSTYEWTITGGSITTSTDSLTPAVTYASAGVYKATLLLNKGLSNEKTITCADSVTVKGEPVKNCVCTNDAKGTVFFKSGSPASVKWSVSGCTGGNTFTYAWSGAATGTGTSVTGSISTAGSGIAPKLVVTNDEQGTMNVTCASVTAEQLLSANCMLGPHDYDANSNTMSMVPGQSFYFKPKSVSGLADNTTATLDLKGSEGTSKQLSVTKGDNSSAVSLTAPTTFGSYTYTLSANGLEVCKATVTVAAPTTKCYLGPYNYQATSTTYSAVPGQTFFFKPDGSSWPSGSSNLSMTLTGGGVTKTLTVAPNGNNSATQLSAPTTTGTYSYDLSLNGTKVCSATLKVEYPNVTGSCSLSSSSVVPGQTTKFKVGSGSWDANILGSDLSMQLTGTDGTSMSVSANRYNPKEYTITPGTKEPGSYTYTVKYGDKTYCSSTLTINKLLSCKTSSTSIKQGESFTFTTTAGGTCKSASTTVNGSSFSSGCKSSQTITPEKSGTYKYKYVITGDYGKDSCETTVTVAEIKPTCSVSDMMRTKGSSFDIKPASAIGCNNTEDGCSYSLTLDGSEKFGGTGYSGGKLSEQLVGEVSAEGDTITADYVLSLTNGTGTGTCNFTVTYIDTLNVTVTTSSSKYDAGKVYKLSTGDLGYGPYGFKCKFSSGSGTAGVIDAKTLTTSGSYSMSSNSEYIFATDADAPSGMTCGLSW